MRYAIALALGLFGPPACATAISGTARVIDGDTIAVHGQRIRLHGIDCPEGRQRMRRERQGVALRHGCSQRAGRPNWPLPGALHAEGH